MVINASREVSCFLICFSIIVAAKSWRGKLEGVLLNFSENANRNLNLIIPSITELTMKYLEIIAKNLEGYEVWKEEKQKCFCHTVGKTKK